MKGLMQILLASCGSPKHPAQDFSRNMPCRIRIMAVTMAINNPNKNSNTNGNRNAGWEATMTTTINNNDGGSYDE